MMIEYIHISELIFHILLILFDFLTCMDILSFSSTFINKWNSFTAAVWIHHPKATLSDIEKTIGLYLAQAPISVKRGLCNA